MALVKVFTGSDSLQAHFVRNLLEREGIAAEVLGDKLAIALGGIPYTGGTMPAVWVAEEAEPAARDVIERMRRGQDRPDRSAEATWTCPHCGETLEPQFTDCWNCGTHRPGAPGGPAERSDALPAPPGQIGLDVPCARCGYNLRSLAPTGRCPECGFTIMPSLLAFIESVRPEQHAETEALLRRPIELAAQGTGLPAAALFFLLTAWVRALATIEPPVRREDPAHERLARQEDAMVLARAVGGTAVADLGDAADAKRAMESWGIQDIRDLGESLFALIEHGLIEPTERVHLEDFPRASIDALFPAS